MELESGAMDKILDAKIDADKLEGMKKKYDPSLEEIFNTTEDQDIHLETDDNNGDKIVKSLYKELLELKIESTSSEEEDSLMDTVIHNIKEEDQDDPATAVPCPPILGGQVYTSNHPSGMGRSTLLGPTNQTTLEPSSTVSPASAISPTSLSSSATSPTSSSS